MAILKQAAITPLRLPTIELLRHSYLKDQPFVVIFQKSPRMTSSGSSLIALATPL